MKQKSLEQTHTQSFKNPKTDSVGSGEAVISNSANSVNIDSTESVSGTVEAAVKGDDAVGRTGRRRFLGQMGGLSLGTMATVSAGLAALPMAGIVAEAAPTAGVVTAGAVTAGVEDTVVAGVSGVARAERAYQVRTQAALNQRLKPLSEHPTNGDEARYPNRIGNFSKGLPHNSLGEVDQAAYDQLLKALRSGDPADFDQIPMGGDALLKNPQAGLTYQLTGMDPAQCEQPPPPAFASAEVASEIAENYWMALARDVNFLDYETSNLAIAAAQDLTTFSDFRGPRYISPTLRAPIIRINGEDGQVIEIDPSNQFSWYTDQSNFGSPMRQRLSLPVTPNVLFRGLTPGDLTGPLVSQFLWKDIPYGVQTISQRMRTPIPGDDYLTRYDDWLFAQNSRGHLNFPNRYDSTRRYVRNGRDLGEWVHIDVLFQAYFNAALILLGMKAPLDEANPYADSKTQCGFGTFGNPHIQSMVCAVASVALHTVWYQKWFVHRRLRPEAFGGRIHNHLLNRTKYPIHNDILKSQAVQEVYRQNGSYLLPIAFAEGAPSHPAYGAGHATVAGACVTVLKAWFDESWVIPDPVVPSADGLTLVPYRGADLTVGGELNKVASNVALGRNMGGVHWRSDATQSLKLGEQVAINYLSDMKNCFNERFGGFSLTKFDGQQIRI